MVWAEDLRCSFSRLAPLGWDVLTEFPASLSWVDRHLNRLVHAPGSSRASVYPTFVVFQSLSHVQLFATPWTAA